MENNLNTILSILTVLGTLGSAAAAFLAIKQTIKQRKMSVTPQLVFNNYQFSSVELKKNYNIFPLDSPKIIKDSPKIINAGAGVALNASVKIEYDYIQKMNYFKLNQALINGGYNFEFTDLSKENEQITISLRGLELDVIKSAERILNIGYITPHSNNAEIKSIKLSPFYFEILINECLFEYYLKNKVPGYISGPLLILTYNDIDGNHYKTNFRSKVLFNIKNTNQHRISFTGVLEFHVEHSNWSKRLLQRIRKSYADFINEHDFNKNRQL